MHIAEIKELLDAFTRSYIETALWSTSDDNEEPLDQDHDLEDISPTTLHSMITDCDRFQQENKTDIDRKDEQAGHDFWLTRNGHGAGFWDGDWPEPAATRLTDASETFGEYYLFIDDEEKIFGG